MIDPLEAAFREDGADFPAEFPPPLAVRRDASVGGAIAALRLADVR